MNHDYVIITSGMGSDIPNYVATSGVIPIAHNWIWKVGKFLS